MVVIAGRSIDGLVKIADLFVTYQPSQQIKGRNGVIREDCTLLF